MPERWRAGRLPSCPRDIPVVLGSVPVVPEDLLGMLVRLA